VAHLKLELGVLTDPGLVRKNNEDSFGCCPPLAPGVLEEKGALYVVADGMGGYYGGEVASAVAVRETLASYYDDPSPDIPTALTNAFQAGHRAVLEEAQRRGASNMGTTIVAAVVRDDKVVVANVGDSPAYLVRKGVVRPLHEEHSWVALAVEKGMITPEKARGHPNRNVITRNLGMDRPLEVYLSAPVPLQRGDVLLLSSDGLTNVVPPEEAGKTAAAGRTPQEAAQALVDLARERGAPDNVTVLILWLGRPVRRSGLSPWAARGLLTLFALLLLGALLAVILASWPR
jgi:serine/threonine protein phosphatase PrpC